ncbi:MAG TPA: hypothetical protein VMB85_04860 [Bryobacteraceae bacterium]|jgi:hypothetical protein|nr:hypothetical protein [Bryobacteraceae bacterium]
MSKLLLKLCAALVLLVPAVQFCWQCRRMPEFGYLHDDAILFVSAKSAAHGDYRIESLPENPAQTKYPPLYPFYLSFIWRIDPHFPENLELATWFSFALLPPFLGLAWFYYRRELDEPRAWILTALLAMNPYVILFGATMFSELFFTCWLMAVFLAIARPGTRMAVLAGLFAGCAYLSRTAGIVLLVSVPALLLWKKETRRAAAFAAAMLPFVAGWMLWTRSHALHSSDPTLIYYTDYLGFQFLNVGANNFLNVLYINADRILWAMGTLFLRDFLPNFAMDILTHVVAVAMIVGVVRLVRRGIARQYAAFALLSVGLLMVWHYPPTERFLLPLYPLLIAGLLTELEHLGQMIKAGFRHRDTGQRVAAGLIAATAAGLCAIAVVLQLQFTLVDLRRQAEAQVQRFKELNAGYAWIEHNLPPSATLLSYDDPLLYLYTGRHGNYLPIMPKWWYAEDYKSMAGAYKDLNAYCHQRGLQYVYFTNNDLDREFGDSLRREVQQEVRTQPGLTPVHVTPQGTVYKVD